METFIVTGCGHSGTRLLSLQLGQAPGWTVLHEPDDCVLARLVAKRFEGKKRYGEVNSFLLTAARYVPVGKRGVIVRNPYDLVRSTTASLGMHRAVAYVREAVSVTDNLIRDGFLPIKFAGITSDPAYVVAVARELGIESLDEATVRTGAKINAHYDGPLDKPDLPFDRTTRDEFDLFIYLHQPQAW
ncbi:MAG TPA: hypothetical protein VD932_02785 [Aquabacterium sp.]|nr:hypothetical protein [Aquabacterium sp.]